MVIHSYLIFPTPMGYKHISYCEEVCDTKMALEVAKEPDCPQCVILKEASIDRGIQMVRNLGTSDAITNARVAALKKGALLTTALNLDPIVFEEAAALSSAILRSAGTFLGLYYDVSGHPSSILEPAEKRKRFIDCCLLKTPNLCRDCEEFVEQECARREISTAIAVIRIVAALKIGGQKRNYLKKTLYTKDHRKTFDELVYIRNKWLAHWDPDFVGDIRMAKSPMLFPGWARIRPILWDFLMESVRLCDEELSRKAGMPLSSGFTGRSGQISNYWMDEEDYEGIYKAILGQ